MSDYQTRICEPSERAQALELLFSHLAEPERGEQVKRLLNECQTESLDLDGLIVCRLDSRLAGAALAQVNPGRTMFLWPPRVAPILSGVRERETYSRLLHYVRSSARERDVRLVQSLLSDDDRDLAPVYLASGFRRLTRLVYLQRFVDDVPIAPPKSDLEFIAYEPARHTEFLAVLDRSYHDTRDCPELNGVRSLEEIFASHKAQGEFNPDHWLLAHRGGDYVGCLLLAGLPSIQAVEIAYVAVLPEARGGGLGRELTRHAFRLAKSAGAQIVTLAVDGRNEPARKMYESEGFEPWDARDVYLLILESARRQTGSKSTT